MHHGRKRKVKPLGPSTSKKRAVYVSGREDSNLRLLGPKPSALAGLSYAPNRGRGALSASPYCCEYTKKPRALQLPRCARYHIFGLWDLPILL
jgi:hypothetical protein